MRAILFSLMMLLGASSAFGQQAPDNDLILKEILNSDSPRYYPRLFTRYMAGDTTLTLEDYRFLYYGYVWQDTYKPFETPAAKDQLLEVLEKNPDPDAAAFGKIVEYANEVMKTRPYDPANINFLVYAYGSLGDTVNERINFDRLHKIVEAIRSSGTGLKESSPWCIIDFSHATDVLAVMKLTFRKPMVITRTIEYIPLLVRQEGVKGYYFDYGRIYMFRPDKLPEKRNTGWEFNGIPIKKK